MLPGLGSLQNEGGFTGGAADGYAGATGGDATGSSGTGDKNINIGANPNVKSINNGMLIVAGLVALWLLTGGKSGGRKKGK